MSENTSDPSGSADQNEPGAESGSEPAARPSARDADRPAPVQLTDAGGLRALAHPLRIALLDALLVHGPLTATQASEVVGESPSNCSFHLRQLAKYGVVEAAEGPDRRSRPWQVPRGGLEIGGDLTDPESAAADQALSELMATRVQQALVDWGRRTAHEPRHWRRATTGLTTVQWLTAEEAERMSHELTELVTKYERRKHDAAERPPDSRPMRIFLHAFPAGPTPADAGDESEPAND